MVDRRPLLLIIAVAAAFAFCLSMVSPASVRVQAQEDRAAEIAREGYAQRQTQAQERQAVALENIARELARLRADCR